MGLGRVACLTHTGSADRFQVGPPGWDTWCVLCVLRTRGVLPSRCPSGQPSDTYMYIHVLRRQGQRYVSRWSVGVVRDKLRGAAAQVPESSFRAIGCKAVCSLGRQYLSYWTIRLTANVITEDRATVGRAENKLSSCDWIGAPDSIKAWNLVPKAISAFWVCSTPVRFK